MANGAKQRKIAIMGYRSVGKSSLTIQYVEEKFGDNYDPTIENTFTKAVKIKNQDFYLRLVDTAGQDEYSIFPAQYAVDIHGYVLVYSINSLKSFEVVKVIYDKLLDMTGKVHVPIFLVGNKLDLSNERVVPSEDGRRLAQQWNAHFVELSAKDHQNVTSMFNNLILAIEGTNKDVPKPEGTNAGGPSKKIFSCNPS